MLRLFCFLALITTPALAASPEIDWKGRDGLVVTVTLPGHVEARAVALTVTFGTQAASPEEAVTALRAQRDAFLAHLAGHGFPDVPLTEAEAEVKPARGDGFVGELAVEVDLPLAGDLFDVLDVVATGSPSGFRLAGYRHPDLASAFEALKGEALESARAAAVEAAEAEGRMLGELRAVKFSDPPARGGRMLDFEVTLEAEFAAPKP